MTKVRRLVFCLLLSGLLTLPAVQASAFTGSTVAGLGVIQGVLARITLLLRTSIVAGDVPPPQTENGQTMDPDG